MGAYLCDEDYGRNSVLGRDSFKSLELDLAKKKIIYTDCKVLEFSSVTQGRGSILATVKISADERKII